MEKFKIEVYYKKQSESTVASILAAESNMC